MLSQVQNMNALSNSDQLTWTVRLNPPQFLWLDVSYIVHQTLGPSTSSTLKSPPQAIPQGKKCRAIYCIHTLYSPVQQSLSLSIIIGPKQQSSLFVHKQTKLVTCKTLKPTHKTKFSLGCAASSFQCAHVEPTRNMTWQV